MGLERTEPSTSRRVELTLWPLESVIIQVNSLRYLTLLWLLVSLENKLWCNEKRPVLVKILYGA